MDAREREKMMLDRCVTVARQVHASACNGAEANVFRLAGSVLRSRLPAEASRLKAASAAYFADHPDEQLDSAEVIRRGLVVSMPRLRDMLSSRLGWNSHAGRWLNQEDSVPVDLVVSKIARLADPDREDIRDLVASEPKGAAGPEFS